jgi:hypothetical protein
VRSDPPLTKRQLGWLLAGVALAAALGILAADIVGAGRFGGLGPAQRLALLGAAGLLVFGLSLVPLGNRPA